LYKKAKNKAKNMNRRSKHSNFYDYSETFACETFSWKRLKFSLLLSFEVADKTFPNKLSLTEKLSPRSSQRCIAELANFKPDRPLKPIFAALRFSSYWRYAE
jgi:hypothetical protein